MCLIKSLTVSIRGGLWKILTAFQWDEEFETISLANVGLFQCSPGSGLGGLMGAGDDVFRVSPTRENSCYLARFQVAGSYPAHQEVLNTLRYFSESLWRNRGV